MAALLINAQHKSELKFLTDLLKKLNIEARVLSQEEQEDILDILSIQATKDEETISFEEFAESQGFGKKTTLQNA